MWRHRFFSRSAGPSISLFLPWISWPNSRHRGPEKSHPAPSYPIRCIYPSRKYRVVHLYHVKRIGAKASHSKTYPKWTRSLRILVPHGNGLVLTLRIYRNALGKKLSRSLWLINESIYVELFAHHRQSFYAIVRDSRLIGRSGKMQFAFLLLTT